MVRSVAHQGKESVNNTSRLELIIKRDQTIVLSSLGAAVVLSWVYLVHLAGRMADMPEAVEVAVAQLRPWSAIDFGLIFLMWTVMMLGMMGPSAMPAVLDFAASSHKQQEHGHALVSTGVFALGYIVVWTGFSLLATGLQWGLHSAALLSPMMVSTSPLLGGGLLIVAGVYQWTPILNIFLERCRNPLELIMKGWSRGSSAFVMGMENGTNCLGCCMVVMALLFVGGVMNLLWVAAITIFVLIEKAVPYGDMTGRISAVALMLAGLFVIVQSLIT